MGHSKAAHGAARCLARGLNGLLACCLGISNAPRCTLATGESCSWGRWLGSGGPPWGLLAQEELMCLCRWCFRPSALSPPLSLTPTPKMPITFITYILHPLVDTCLQRESLSSQWGPSWALHSQSHRWPSSPPLGQPLSAHMCTNVRNLQGSLHVGAEKRG